MKERPILFSSPMVRAILDGTKTQTRRIAPIAQLEITRTEYEPILSPGILREFHGWFIKFQRKENGRTKGPKGVSCSTSGTGCSELEARQYIAQMYNPYGVPGDLLWVREAWRTAKALDGMNAGQIEDRCEVNAFDVATVPIEFSADSDRRSWPTVGVGGSILPGRYRHSRFMPRWASRITLEIVSVRVEKLQYISEEDAKAEGSKIAAPLAGGWWFPESFETEGAKEYGASYKNGYRQLWESINGLGSWDANPWVFVIEFKRVEVSR